ncbi:hypothetical protein C2G38_2234324 [Gigaspora rosea]|uniref:Uncharacterized protein n=1 Tax=Gigaspora rosea TaxID=44941 RepID=A0A397TZ63_9GLOM|nr:hypothetical protein C2G38_2234324 [Gigaspora rosea]
MDKQAAEFQQLVHEVVGGNYIKDVQFYEDLKIVLEILEDLIDRERIVKNSDKTREEKDRKMLVEVENRSNERKDSNKLKKSFDSETLNYACKSWLKREPRDASCTGLDMSTKAKVDEPENGTSRPICSIYGILPYSTEVFDREQYATVTNSYSLEIIILEQSTGTRDFEFKGLAIKIGSKDYKGKRRKEVEKKEKKRNQLVEKDLRKNKMERRKETFTLPAG